ncbi:formimidoylglutamate deiminase [Geminicoccus roseus]|uniref:formimidoylglutamate deiminase n=1 Tax=Geminicoccus roseus TaxID=404900 RepID=UPI000428592E|nr:formimidoylglutamate deiminase [Geminicoccus roseus]
MIHAIRALLPEGWATDVLVQIDARGDIANVQAGVPAPPEAERAGILLPGVPDIHSHAFQRAMAGLAERLPSGEASFWTWRAVMYAFAGTMTPEMVRAVATQLYVEMLEAGYTTVGEFHYLHHRADGRPHDDPAEMALAHLEAARAAGIGMTMLPTLYQTGGFDQPAEPGQIRFLHELDGYLRLVERLRAEMEGRPDERLGIAPHSLRAVPPKVLQEAVRAWRDIDPDGPVHIHLAEQVREVRECLEATGRRPGERLLDLVEPDARWTLIHATHLEDAELAALAASGAVAGLCPSTEGNLGDGLFRLADWLEQGGALAIGTDSHVVIDPFEELRWLEHGQRTRTLRRTVAASLAEPHSGARLLRAVLEGGRQAMGRPIGRIEAGARADLVVLDERHPRLVERPGDLLLDSLVLAPGRGMVRHVMAGGTWQVRDGRHRLHEEAAAAYRQAVAGLAA